MRTLTAVVGDGLRYPAVAAGLLHWARHAIAADALTVDVNLLPACGVLHRMAAALVSAWPAVAPAALGLYHHSLALAGAGDAAAARHRDATMRAFVDLMTGGFALPVLAYVRRAAPRWDIGLLRRFLNSVVGSLEPPYSLAAALELVRLVAACQERLVAAKKAAGAAAGAGAGAGGEAVVSSITIDRREQLVEAVRHITRVHVKGILVPGAAPVPLPPNPQRTELRALLTAIDRLSAQAF